MAIAQNPESLQIFQSAFCVGHTSNTAKPEDFGDFPLKKCALQRIQQAPSMSDLKLFKLAANQVTELSVSSMALEKSLQTLIEISYEAN